MYVSDYSARESLEADMLGVLHSLYSVTFTPQGRDAVVYVFTLEDNMSALLPFIDIIGIVYIAYYMCNISLICVLSYIMYFIKLI